MSAPKINRKLHRIGAILTAAPLLVVIATGLLLQLKKESSWIQPPTSRGSAAVPSLSFERILESARSAQKGIESWKDVDRLDVRPGRGIVKVRGKNRWEIQVDTATGEVKAVNYRRSDLIESLHDGSWFHERAKLWIFLPCAVIFLGLWFTGIYLWWLPHGVKRRRRKGKREHTAR